MQLIKYSLCVSLLTSIAMSASADTDFATWLRGSAAACKVDSTGEYDKMYLLSRDKGESSGAYKTQVANSYAVTEKCVATTKPLGKGKLRAAIAEMPEEKAALQSAYAAWLGYMKWLESPHDILDESREQTLFEQRMNELDAVLDSR